MTQAYQALKKQLTHEPRTWLVTGCAGFIGSNLLEELLSLNQKVVGLDNLSTGFRANLDEVRDSVTAEQWKRFSFIEGDIRSMETCQKACVGVDYVLHQAALGSVPRSISNPIDSNEVNVSGQLNTLIAARDAKARRFVYASSSSVYGDHPALPKKEENVGNLLSPYAVTKFVDELYGQVFSKNYQMEIVGLRYFNVFGRRQSPAGAYAAVIPLWFDALLRGAPVKINGDGETSRDFTYIENVVQVNLLAATAPGAQVLGGAYNVAFGDRTTLNELYSLIREQVARVAPARAQSILSAKPVYQDFRAGDIRHSLADISKARNELGYDPQKGVREGLLEAADWYLKYFSNV